MKLTLHHDEVQQYFDMRDDLAYWQKKAQELEDELDMLRESTTTQHDEVEYREPPVVSTERSYPEGTTKSPHTASRWESWEETLLSHRIDPTSTAKKSERTLVNCIIKLPGRTEAAIRSKIGLLGGYIRHGNVYQK